MGDEASLAAHLSLRLSPPQINVILASYDDVNAAFLAGRGYDLNLVQLNDVRERTSIQHHHSYRLLEVAAEMLSYADRLKATKDVHAICCAFSIPTYHVMVVSMRSSKRGEDDARKLLNYATKSYVVSKANRVCQLRLVKGFDLFKRSLERHRWHRHLTEVYCLVRFLTRDFTRQIRGKPFVLERSTISKPFIPAFWRIKRLIVDVFGPKYATTLGENVVVTAFNAYLSLYYPEVDCVPFEYTLIPHNGYSGDVTSSDNVQQRILDNYTSNQSVTDTFDWFLVGRHYPIMTTHNIRPWVHQDLSDKCVLLQYPQLNVSVPVNIQVVHIRVFSKTRMKYTIPGKSLVSTVEKKKTVAGSSYKDVEADEVVMTPNSINYNLHGYDNTLIITVLLLGNAMKVCGIDDLATYSVSHNRFSSHSFQNGVIDTNSYRQTVMERFPEICSKVPHFPVVKMTNLGLLHRETVLINLPSDPERCFETIHHIIQSSAEIDNRLERDIYRYLETQVRELIDNHILGMFKIAYLCDKGDLARDLAKILTFDRLLIGFNPKTSKSEFADKSKFDSESKGKASKRIKTPDSTRDRTTFQMTLNQTFPDVSIDPANSNSRGKWSFPDRIFINTTDWVFYSPLVKSIVARLSSVYPATDYPRFNAMLSMIKQEIQK